MKQLEINSLTKIVVVYGSFVRVCHNLRAIQFQASLFAKSVNTCMLGGLAGSPSLLLVYGGGKTLGHITQLNLNA